MPDNGVIERLFRTLKGPGHCPMGANFRFGAMKRPVIPDKDAARILPRAEGAMA